ncbi:glutaredoxin family protein [Veronia pacifica]|uniref:NrdH-redoxin n=1 Tax=Veronia pacifica TaxID=1080227 RepID=A0A1C3EMV6_9GAMM|nr:glutaredoxin family protein [Veronia pacifica]ODA34577.1 NrdH-redoxin [Veronia pacifica]
MKRIVLYTARHCAHCKSAQQYLEQKKLSFRLCDVSTPRGKKEHASLGARGVPVIKVGDKILHGFSAKALEKALKI